MSEETKDNALNEAVEQIEKAVGKVDESTKSVIEVEKSLSELQTSNAQVVKDVVEMRAYLEAEHGKSGAQDFEHEMSKFISKAFKHNKTNKTSASRSAVRCNSSPKANYSKSQTANERINHESHQRRRTRSHWHGRSKLPATPRKPSLVQRDLCGRLSPFGQQTLS